MDYEHYREEDSDNIMRSSRCKQYLRTNTKVEGEQFNNACYNNTEPQDREGQKSRFLWCQIFAGIFPGGPEKIFPDGAADNILDARNKIFILFRNEEISKKVSTKETSKNQAGKM